MQGVQRPSPLTRHPLAGQERGGDATTAMSTNSDSRPDARRPYFDPGLDCAHTASLSHQAAYHVAITFIEAVELSIDPAVIIVDGSDHTTIYLQARGPHGLQRWQRQTSGLPPSPIARATPVTATTTDDGELIDVYGDIREKHQVKQELIAFLTGAADTTERGADTTVHLLTREHAPPLPMPPEQVP